ncbi:hypothetical protein FNV43_RR18977 [Rhamnella rubrinervis]|uniref:Protein S-acyltransferase n=1 Tax=Rhamnella rubrinervis TaxID=2594499 RepID=A0A8K0EBQ4_9ROSA|nr:hypothetical protein FNV43_RR18977 [Rhamnella rubrinervis]
MAWNVFKFCTALRGLGSIMILLVLGVVGVTYYAVVLTNYGPALYDGGLDCVIALAVLILFHCLNLIYIGDIKVYKLERFSVILQLREEADPLNGSEFSGLQPDQSNQRIRYCRKCNQPKPPRCHHCSVFLNLAFALSVLGFLIMHISLVAANTTTIEAYEKKTTPKWRYDLGRKKNFEQVFGTDKLYWFIPAYSEEDLRRMPALQGLEYPSKPDYDSQEF